MGQKRIFAIYNFTLFPNKDKSTYPVHYTFALYVCYITVIKGIILVIDELIP